jgi:hypothetical protein
VISVSRKALLFFLGGVLSSAVSSDSTGVFSAKT